MRPTPWNPHVGISWWSGRDTRHLAETAVRKILPSSFVGGLQDNEFGSISRGMIRRRT